MARDAVLVTDVAGFIGSTIAPALLSRGDSVHRIDDFSLSNVVGLKEMRLARLEHCCKFTCTVLGIVAHDKIGEPFVAPKFDGMVNLAAEAET